MIRACLSRDASDEQKLSMNRLTCKDLLAVLRKSLDHALALYIFIHEARLSCFRASIAMCIFENTTNCNKISLDPDSFLE